MNKNCLNCGRQLTNEEKFCPSCGTPVNNEVNQQTVQNEQVNQQPMSNQPMNNVPMGNQPMSNQPMNNMSMGNQPMPNQPMNNMPMGNQQFPMYGNQPMQQKKHTGIIVGVIGFFALVIVLGAVFAFVLPIFNGPKRTVLTLCNSFIVKPDYDKLITVVYDDAEITREEFNEFAKYLEEAKEMNGITKVTCAVGKIEDVSRSELDDFKDEYGSKVTSVKNVEMKVTTKSKKDGVESDSTNVKVFKINGKWYVDDIGLDDF